MIWRHPFQPVAGHDDDNECTYQWGASDRTYCGRPESDHRDTLR